MSNQDERIAKMTFASVYPHYVTKIKKKGRTIAELHKIIEWLTGYDEANIVSLIDQKVNFEVFFKNANLHQDTKYINGMICGYRIEEIPNTLTKQVRYLDKIVDELAKGKAVDKIMNRKAK